MTSTQFNEAQLQDRFGRAVTARLDTGTRDLPYDIHERLRAARAQALAKRRPEPRFKLRIAASVFGSGGTAALGLGGQSWWNRLASALPIVALAAGLVLIHKHENERRASEVAEVDAALLTDELPPSAYADPGFVQFLKTSQSKPSKD